MCSETEKELWEDRLPQMSVCPASPLHIQVSRLVCSHWGCTVRALFLEQAYSEGVVLRGTLGKESVWLENVQE